jgi:hypothetical protein
MERLDRSAARIHGRNLQDRANRMARGFHRGIDRFIAPLVTDTRQAVEHGS